MEKERGKLRKGRREIIKGRGRSIKMSMQRTSFSFLFFFFFFFFACHFLKPQEFVWGVPKSKWKISTEKKHISRREKIGKSDFAPSEKYSSYATIRQESHTCSCRTSLSAVVWVQIYKSE